MKKTAGRSSKSGRKKAVASSAMEGGLGIEFDTDSEREPTRLEMELTEKEDGEDNLDDIDEGAEYVTDSLQQYLNDVSATQTRLLSLEEELYLGRMKDENNDEMALNTLVVFNLKLVVKLAAKYYKHGMGVHILDVIQNGNMGLIKAAKKYDYKRGFRFSTYATYWIKQSIARNTQRQIGMIPLPMSALEKIRLINKSTEEYIAKNGSEPGLKELAKATGLTEDEIIEIWRVKQGPIFLDEKYDENDGEGSLMDKLITDESADPYEQTSRVMLLEEMGYLKRVLTAREYEMITLRHGLNGVEEHTLEAIAKKKGSTREQVRQDLASIYAKLKKDEKVINLAEYLA